LRLGKAKQLRLKTTHFFPREKEELPQAGLGTHDVLHTVQTLYQLMLYHVLYMYVL